MRLFTLLIVLHIAAGTTFAQHKEKRVLIDRGYYPDGTLEYKSKTKRKGIQPDQRIMGKQVIRLKEYYKNGQLELREKKIIPRVIDEQHLTEDRHLLKQKKEWRKYKMWDEDGRKLEKGKYNYRGKKKVVKYRYAGYKKVIIRFNPEVGRDEETKKKPIYK